jgi:DNA polymerase III alpha subunit
LHLGLIKAIKQSPGANFAPCLFLDRFIESLDQAALEKLVLASEAVNFSFAPIVVTSSNPEHKKLFKRVAEANADQTSRELIRLATLCRKGLADRCRTTGTPDQARQKRLDKEMLFSPSSTINTLLELSEYLRGQDIPFSAGSGRASSSMLLYALGITDIDPFSLNLPSEQFYLPLCKGKPLPVWFDIPDKYQDSVFEYASKKYGREKAMALFPGIDCVAMWYFTEALLKLQEITAAIEKDCGSKINLAAIPLADPETFALLSAGDTAGIYGLNGLVASDEDFDRKKVAQYPAYLQDSAEIKEALISFKPTTFAELMIIVALFNLSPLSNWRNDLLPRVLHHKKMKTFAPQPLPVLQNSLKDTFGLLIYQEQLHEIIIKTSGFDTAQAERFIKLVLRGYFNDKERTAFEAMKQDFLTAGKTNGYDEDQLQIVLQFIYEGINKCTIKANTANHTLVAYRMAYLKAHHRDEFILS